MLFSSSNSSGIVVVIVVLVAVAIFLAISIPVLVVEEKYKKFVLEHSVAIKQLNDINKRYQFKEISKFDMDHSYDNEKFYGDISCKDFLTYQLVYIQKKVRKAIKDTINNKNLFEEYKDEIKHVCVMDQYDTTELLKNRKRLARFENKLFAKQIKMPTTSFSIMVRLKLTNINGVYQRSKYDEFSSDTIKILFINSTKKEETFI